MVRFILVLMGLFNFAMFRSWCIGFAVISLSLEKFMPAKVLTSVIGGLTFLLFFLFLIHSFRLIMFQESARKNQIILCVIDPFIRGIIFFAITVLKMKNVPPATTLMYALFVLICIDALFVYTLRRANFKETFRIAEEERAKQMESGPQDE